MRKKITGAILSVLGLGLFTASALAADLGTYRPGTAYQTISAPAAQVCDNYCSGDARCRGWNFVKVNRDAPGICEFQSRVSDPVSSAVSISGLSATSPNGSSNNLVQGGTRTIRVGTDTPLERSTPEKIRQAYANVTPKVQDAGRHPSRPAQSYTGAPVRSPSTFKPLLDSQSASAIRPRGRAVTPPVVSRAQPYNQFSLNPTSAAPMAQPRQIKARHQPARQSMRALPTRGQSAPRKVLMQPQLQPLPTQSLPAAPPARLQSSVGQMRSQASSGRPPIGQTIDAPATYPARVIVPPRPEAMQRSSVNSPVGFTTSRPAVSPDFPAAKQGLYGNLYDDVPVPPPSNASRAMTTSQQRRVTPIDQEPLISPRR